jgi:Concanavalin A-like lectin/glucanases superfamily
MSTFSDLIIADGAIAYWRLGELANPLVDIAGGHNGTGSNVTFGQDGIDSDKSILTDGASGRVTTGWSLTLPASFTIEAWVKIPAGTPEPVLGNRPVISNYAASGTMTVNINGNDVILSFSGATPVSSSATVGTIPDNQWHQIVVKSTATSTIFLFDGVLKQTNGHSKPAASAGTVFIGYDFAADLFFQGGLDEIAIFPTSLLTSKILAHYNAGTTPAGPVIPLLPLSISTGVATDLVQNRSYGLPPRLAHVTSTTTVEVSMDGTTFTPLVGAETVGARTGAAFIRSTNATCSIIAKEAEAKMLA